IHLGNIRLQVILTQSLEIRELQLADQGAPTGILNDKKPGKIVLDSLQFPRGRRLRPESIYFAENLLQGSACKLRGDIRSLGPVRIVIAARDLAEWRIGVPFLFADIGGDTRVERPAEQCVRH